MQPQIDDYLAEVSAHLAVLPTARRNEELKEMRQHLLASIVINREFGQSEVEAMSDAIQQFGSPEELASSIVWTWQRGQRRLKRDLLGATVCAFVFLSLLPRLVLTMEQVHKLPAIQSLHSSFWIAVTLLLWQLPPWLVAGAVTGLMFPRRAVAGTALVIVAWDLAIVAQDVVNAFLTAQPWHLTLIGILMGLRAFLFNGSPYDLTAILSAWAVSRWRQARRDRTALSAT